MHVLDGSRVTRRFLPQCVVDFSFAPLAPLRGAFRTLF